MQIKEASQPQIQNWPARVEVLQPEVVKPMIRPGSDLELQRNPE